MFYQVSLIEHQNKLKKCTAHLIPTRTSSRPDRPRSSIFLVLIDAFEQVYKEGTIVDIPSIVDPDTKLVVWWGSILRAITTVAMKSRSNWAAAWVLLILSSHQGTVLHLGEKPDQSVDNFTLVLLSFLGEYFNNNY
uniref:Uncharacterized protein n=1 Tax=Timema cristinae TaxID=61476 RepID=A0A7R9D948_TIMCR|nr:unnamed protein product [Timema cristinae]